MNKRLINVIGAACVALMGVALMSFLPADDNILTTEDNVTIVNTTQLSKDVKGFRGPTPVKIYIKKGKIQRVEALPNQESPRFFEKVRTGLLPKWGGMSVKKAASRDVDGVTGATFSSKAIKQNVKLGLDYYQHHR